MNTPMSTKVESKPRLKVVVRSLPYCLNEDEFKKAITNYMTETDFFYYVQGKKSQKKEVDSRAYLHFSSPTILFKFHEVFSGHTFVDQRGKEYRCSVEYAPYQKVLRKQPPCDPRQNTIEDDLDYQRFIEQLHRPPEYLPSAEIQYEERKKREENEKPKSTPLLEELKAKAQMHLKQKTRGGVAPSKQRQSNPRKIKPKSPRNSGPERPASRGGPSRGAPPSTRNDQSEGSDSRYDDSDSGPVQQGTTTASSPTPTALPIPSNSSYSAGTVSSSQKREGSGSVQNTNGITNSSNISPRTGGGGRRPPRPPVNRTGGRGGRGGRKGTWKERDPSSSSTANTQTSPTSTSPSMSTVSPSSPIKNEPVVMKIQVRDAK